MRIEVIKRERLFSPNDYDWRINSLTHAANPILIESSTCENKILFNSRTTKNRSEIWSVDFDIEKQSIIHGSAHRLLQENEFPGFASDGVSLGGILECNNLKYLFFMGWKAPYGKHWHGELGLLRIKEFPNFSITPERNPMMEIGSDEPISISYADSATIGETKFIWYGSTDTWDAGNGEMIHKIKVRKFINGKWVDSKTAIEPQIGFAQAFSKPSFITSSGRNLLAFSYRGNSTKYRIGFCSLTSDGIGSEISWESFLPEGVGWESEMVEYPFLFHHEGTLRMLYNGNSYGKTGIGMATLKVDD